MPRIVAHAPPPTATMPATQVMPSTRRLGRPRRAREVEDACRRYADDRNDETDRRNRREGLPAIDRARALGITESVRAVRVDLRRLPHGERAEDRSDDETRTPHARGDDDRCSD